MTRSSIFSAIRTIADEQGKSLPPLTDDLVLLESGLDSLGFAILIARLEAELGTDPFASADLGEFPVTLGDLVRIYDHACAQNEAA